MSQHQFISRHRTEAERAGKAYGLNPTVLLAQAALESGWGQSRLAVGYNNLFGITAYGPVNEQWAGEAVSLGKGSLLFRAYPSAGESFLDYARLIRLAYPTAAELSSHPEAFARAISPSRTISGIDDDNRESYRQALGRLCHQISQAMGEDYFEKVSGSAGGAIGL